MHPCLNKKKKRKNDMLKYKKNVFSTKTGEEKEKIKAINNNRMRKAYTSMSEQEKDKRKKEMLQYCKNVFSAKTEEDKEKVKANENKRKRIRYETMNEQDKQKRISQMTKINEKNKNEKSANNTIIRETLNIPEIFEDLNIEQSMNEALEQMMMTSIDDDEWHCAMICIVCDRFIIGTEKLCWIAPYELKKSEQRLSVENYETNLGYKLPSELRDYYKVDHPDLSNMLLSKRAFKENSNGNFLCCTQCNRALKRKVKTPPKVLHIKWICNWITPRRNE